jgi:hypothetical protein
MILEMKNLKMNKSHFVYDDLFLLYTLREGEIQIDR